MSLRELVSTQCGTQNPLSELSQQLQGREHLQQFSQRYVPPQAAGEIHSGIAGGARAAPSTFHMGELLSQMNRAATHQQSQQQLGQQHSSNQLADPGSLAGRTWAGEFIASPMAAASAPGQSMQARPWCAEFLTSASAVQPQASFRASPASSGPALGYPRMAVAPVFVPGSAPSMVRMEPVQFPSQSLQTHAADSTSVKWAEDILAESEQRNANDLAELQKVARDFVRSEADPTVMTTDFFKFVEKVGSEAPQQSADSTAAISTAATTNATAEKWASELAGETEQSTSRANAQDDTKFWKDLAENWNNNMSFNSTGEQWPQGVDVLPESYRSYGFNEQNPLLQEAGSNPFEAGLQKLSEGDLPSAVLLFEAAVKKDSAHAEAWQHLGTTQAQNEQDVKAIAALRQCLALQPQNGAAMLALAVSYTNEGLQRQACEVLAEWLRVNPKYAHIVKASDASGAATPSSQGPQVFSTMVGQEHKRILDMYISAAQIQPEQPDPDVQSCLGVLLSLSGDYDKAVDCFRAAVAVRPHDSLLWNRLGASLANGGKSEEAVEAYRHSLQLHPGFIRARFNLGITCVNLGSYHEAAEHFLTALNLQDNAKAAGAGELAQNTAMSDNVWNTLRMSITLMNRRDLYGAVDTRDLKTLNQVFMKQDAAV